MAARLALVVLLVAPASCSLLHTGSLRSSGRAKTEAQMRPEMVAKLLAAVEDDWWHEATEDTANPKDSGKFFDKSCKTVAEAAVSSSNGDHDKVQLYMDRVCAQGVLNTWHKSWCDHFQKSLGRAMKADSYSNREGLSTRKFCNTFWTTFATLEQQKRDEDRVKKIAERKKLQEENEAREKKEKEAWEKQKAEKLAAEKKRLKEELEEKKRIQEAKERAAALAKAQKEAEEKRLLDEQKAAQAKKAAEEKAKADAERLVEQQLKEAEEQLKVQEAKDAAAKVEKAEAKALAEAQKKADEKMAKKKAEAAEMMRVAQIKMAEAKQAEEENAKLHQQAEETAKKVKNPVTKA